jgi:hypothetical protein
MGSKIWIFTIVALTEAVYIATAVVTIRHIRRNKTYGTNNELLDNFILIFLVAGILASLNNFFPEVTRIPFVLFIICEQLLLFVICRIILERGKYDYLLFILFSIPLFGLPILLSKESHQILYDLTYACSSLTATTLAFVYFRQMAKKNTVLDVFKDKNTLIMLGLFLSYSIPLTCTVAILAMELLEPGLSPEIHKSEGSRTLLVLITRITTICYTVLNIFILKAYRCQQQASPGISLH